MTQRQPKLWIDVLFFAGLFAAGVAALLYLPK